MSKSDVFHLGLTKNDLQGATLAIVPGALSWMVKQ